MVNLSDYLMAYNVKKKTTKGKKLKRPKRVRWGQRMGKAATTNNKNKDSNIEKLLTTLIARTAPPNSIEIARTKQLEEDYQMAQNIDQKQRLEESKGIYKSKKMNEDMNEETQTLKAPNPSPISSVARPMRFQAYQQEYDSIEEEYNELIQSMTDDMGNSKSVIRSEAMSDFIAKKQQLNANRNVLRKELLDDIKDNPSEVWEWRGFIEQSEVGTSNLLELDNKASQILYDQATRNLEEKEELSKMQVEQATKNQEAMKEQLNKNIELRLREEEFTKELENANEKLGEQKIKLIQEATQREIAVEELDQTQKFLSETIGATFNKGEENLKAYLAGNLGGQTNAFKIALGQTGLDERWAGITSRTDYGTEDKKLALKLALNKKIEEQEKFLPRKIESFTSALPPGSVMLMRDDSLEDLRNPTGNDI